MNRKARHLLPTMESGDRGHEFPGRMPRQRRGQPKLIAKGNTLQADEEASTTAVFNPPRHPRNPWAGRRWSAAVDCRRQTRRRRRKPPIPERYPPDQAGCHLRWPARRDHRAAGVGKGPARQPVGVPDVRVRRLYWARRSEIVRALPSDVDLAGGFVTIRENKRDKTKLTTRRVPLTPFLKEVLADWMKKRGKGKALFCKLDGRTITPREAHNYFQRGLASRNGRC